MPRSKPPRPDPTEYLEVEVDGRRCFVNRDDFRIFSGLASHVKGTQPKHWNELDEDSFIVQVTVMRKWSRGGKTKQTFAQIPLHPPA